MQSHDDNEKDLRRLLIRRRKDRIKVAKQEESGEGKPYCHEDKIKD